MAQFFQEVHRSKATEDQVKLKAEEELQKNPEVQAIISADKEVPHGKVVGMMDIIKSVGVKKFAIEGLTEYPI